MRYKLMKMIEAHGKGCPEDESESWDYETTFFFVGEDKEEEFGEFVADCSGSQDYSFRVDFYTIGTFDWADLLGLKDALDKKISEAHDG
jgi:hypothetical protein